jgi:hypothetical protein
MFACDISKKMLTKQYGATMLIKLGENAFSEFINLSVTA